MKAPSLLLALLLLGGCAREYASSFTVKTVIPAGVKDARREAWKVERMLESARFHDLAFAHDASLRAARFHFDVIRVEQRIEVFAIAASDDIAFRAAQAYAKAARDALANRRPEFEILGDAKIDIGPVSSPASK